MGHGAFFKTTKRANPKHEIRNPKQIQIFQILIFKTFWILVIRILKIISNFDIRYSNFIRGMNKIMKYILESKAELKKVVWPTKKETTNYTLLVIAISLGIAAFFGVLDYFFSLGLQELITNFK